MPKEYIFTFDTISQALKFEKDLKKINIDVKLMPVPRALSSSCGTSARVYSDDEEIIENLNKLGLIYHEYFIM